MQHFSSLNPLTPITVIAVYAMVGLARGGQQVGKCKEVFGKAVQLLVELASLQVGVRWGESVRLNHLLTVGFRRRLSLWMK